MLTTLLSDLQDMATETSWMDAALCAQADPAVFFPADRHGPADWEPAFRVCGRCTAWAECLDYAVRHEVRYGVWGGVNMAAVDPDRLA